MCYVCDVLYAGLYVRVSYFVVRGCAVSRRYIDVCNYDMFSVVNVYLDHLKFCVVCINGRRYVYCGECYVVSNDCDETTSCLVQPIGAHCCEVMYFECFAFRGELGFRNCDDTHTRTQPPTLTKYTNSYIHPPQTSPPPLSLVHPPPKTPTSVQPPKTPTYTSSPPAPTLTPYTLDRIQPTRPDSLHIPPSHKLPYVPTPAHSHTRNKQKTSKTKHKEIRILKLNANGIRSTVEELKHLLLTTQPDVVAVQESKLNPASRTPKIPNYTAIRTDRKHKQGGGLITYIKSDTTFTHIKTPQTTRTTQKHNF